MGAAQPGVGPLITGVMQNLEACEFDQAGQFRCMQESIEIRSLRAPLEKRIERAQRGWRVTPRERDLRDPCRSVMLVRRVDGEREIVRADDFPLRGVIASLVRAKFS